MGITQVVCTECGEDVWTLCVTEQGLDVQCPEGHRPELKVGDRFPTILGRLDGE